VKNRGEGEKLRLEDLQRLSRAWEYIERDIFEHGHIEDTILFPKIKASIENEPTKEIILDDIEEDHPKIEKRIKELTEMLYFVLDQERKNEKREKRKHKSTKKSEKPEHNFGRFTELVNTTFEEYWSHIDAEEEKLIPLVKQYMSLEVQKQVASEIKESTKKLADAKHSLLMFRDVALEDPVEAEKFVSGLPWFLRKVLMPIWEHTDAFNKEWHSLFVEEWP